MPNLPNLHIWELNDYYAIWYQTWIWLLRNRPRWTGKAREAQKHADDARAEWQRRQEILGKERE
jgi:hypothetical protein